MTVGDDFKVSRRYRQDIADAAAEWRRTIDPELSANNFNVVDLLVRRFLPSLRRQGRAVELEIVPDDRDEPYAWVDFRAGKLCVQEFIWTIAQAQEDIGRLVLAHEMGHLVLHGDQVHAFSRGEEKKLNFLDPQDSAECQANWFASSLLLPDQTLLRLARLDDYSIATLALVSKRVVQVRRQEMAMDKRYRPYTGDQCRQCGSLRMKMMDTDVVCEDCGITEQAFPEGVA